MLQDNKNTTNQISDTDNFKGSKIPITELSTEIHDEFGNIVYRDVEVLIGHDIPASRIDEIRKKQRSKASIKLKEQSWQTVSISMEP